MDITSTAAVNTNTTSAATTIKTPEAESETPTRIQSVKPLSFSNGVLKRHQPLHHLHHHHHHGFNNHHAVVFTYKECLKNHAASLGGHAVDGCGEFMPSPSANPNDPTSLKCAACGCHRNFHRREPEEPHPPPNTTPALEYQPHHRHHPPPPHRNSPGHSSPSSPSPPPISSSYYPSAPHMLLALSSGLSAPPADNASPISAANTGSGRKRFRTKFTQDQKEKMLDFAERVGWKIQKRDEELISGFCNEVGVERGVLKVWMHNNKNTLGKKDQNSNIVTTTTTTTIPTSTTTTANINNGNGIGFDTTTSSHYHQHDDNTINNNNNDNDNNGQGLSQHHLHNSDSVSAAHVVVNTNGSSSSS